MLPPMVRSVLLKSRLAPMQVLGKRLIATSPSPGVPAPGGGPTPIGFFVGLSLVGCCFWAGYTFGLPSFE